MEWQQRDGTWYKCSSNGAFNFVSQGFPIRLVLATPPDNRPLHNPDNLTAEQVGVGYRLAVIGEELPKAYEYWYRGQWNAGGGRGVTVPRYNEKITCRLHLSVPWPPAPDPYAELKKAHAAGKKIEFFDGCEWNDVGSPSWICTPENYRIKPDEIPWIEWHGGECPLKDEEVEEWEFKMRHGHKQKCGQPSLRRWEHLAVETDIIAYRVPKTREPKPKVPLGPEDVPPGSVVKAKTRTDSWYLVTGVSAADLTLSNGSVIIYAVLQRDFLINRSIPLTGKWNPDAWEPCEK